MDSRMDSRMCTRMVVEWTVEGQRKWTVECVVDWQ